MKVVDSSGFKCPIPMLHLRKGLVSLKVGDSIKLISTDEQSVSDVATFCEQMGHKLIKHYQEKSSWVFIVEKGDE